MKNLFNDMSQDEKNRILEMHQSSTRKNYLSEQTPGMGGVADDNQQKIIKIKSSEEDLNKFLQISQEAVKSVLPNLVFQTKEQWDTIKYPLQQALSWYAKSGRNPTNNPLSSVVANIGGDFPQRYQMMVKGDPTKSGQGFVADAKKLDSIFTQLYNNQLRLV